MPIQEDLEAMFHEVFAYCNLVLEQYKCPKECEGFCCRENKITFGISEYYTIYRRYPKARRVLKTQTVSSLDPVREIEIKSYSFTEHPCPMLSPTNRCSIQEAKPVVCQLYPLGAGNRDSDLAMVTVAPCPIGVKLMADYVLYRSLAIMSNDDMSVKERQKMIDDDIIAINETFEDAKSFREKDRGRNISIPLANFKYFYTFLTMTSPEDRHHDIRQLGIRFPNTV